MTDLRDHIGHELECSCYGECLTCGVVLFDFDCDNPEDLASDLAVMARKRRQVEAESRGVVLP